MNEVSIKLFNTKILQENLFIQPLNDNFLGKNAYSIIYNDKKLDVFGEIFTFSPFEKVLIFKEKKAIHNSILHVTNSTTGTLVKDFIFYSDSMKK